MPNHALTPVKPVFSPYRSIFCNFQKRLYDVSGHKFANLPHGNKKSGKILALPVISVPRATPLSWKAKVLVENQVFQKGID